MLLRSMITLTSCCILAVSMPCALAQQVENAMHLTTADGLSQGVIFDILQDSEGFLWFGTKDGLNRYDGYDFKVFTNDPDDPWSIAENTITLLFEDSQGRIWASTDNTGLDIYDKQSGRFHHLQYDPSDPGGITGTNIRGIVEYSPGNFLLNVDEREINMLTLEDAFFDTQEQPHVIRITLPIQDLNSKVPSTLLKGIIQDTKDRIWVGGPNEIYQLDVQTATLGLVKQGFTVGASLANPDGSIWANHGELPLFHWDGQNATVLSGDFFSTMKYLRDDRDRVWAVCADSLYGLDLADAITPSTVCNPNDRIFFRWQPYVHENTHSFKSVGIDRSGSIWAGTNGFGLYRFNPDHTLIKHRLPNVSIRQITVESDDKFFLWSYSLWWTNDGEHQGNFPLGKHGPAPLTDYLLVTGSGDYWSKEQDLPGNRHVLLRYNQEIRKEQEIEIPWLHFKTQPMLQSRDGNIWITGLNQILTGVDPSSELVTSYDLSTGSRTFIDNQAEKIVSKEYSTAIYEDGAGIFWVGTENEMFRVQRNGKLPDRLDVKRYINRPGEQLSLSYNHVMCFLDDPQEPDKYLWVCTKGGGLNRMHKQEGTFLRLTTEDGLPDNVVYGLLSDDNGNLWGSTNKGIFCLLRSALDNSAFSFKNFSQKDGFQGEEFNTGSYAKLPGGKMIFGGINGYNIFDPSELLVEDYMPPVHITRLLINNETVSPNDGSTLLNKSIEFAEEITLGPTHEILTLEFASLDFTAPERNRYRYQMLGLDDQWVESDQRRSATFLQLRPNNYTFRVQGTNSHGVWSDQIAELKIRVLPPWWKTKWAYLAYILFMASMVFIALRIYFYRIRLRQQLDFEKREADRIRELEAQKSQLYTNMTHEFRTPLTIILGMAKQLKKDLNGQAHNKFDMIIRNGQNLLGLVNKMLDLSKIESGKLQVNWVNDDIIDFLRNLTSSLSSLVEQKEIQLHFLPEVNVLTTRYDPEKLQQIISNLISNAYKFTPEGGNIYLTVKVEDQTLVLRVKDTGRGISPEHIDQVFDRFYQADPSSTRQSEGTGIGLALTKELVTLLGGQIHAESPPVGARTGAEFIVALPMQADHEVAKLKPPNSTYQTHQPSSPVLENISYPKRKVDQPILQNNNPKESTQPIILLAEDNADVVAYIASCLMELEGLDFFLNGYHLAIAENGQEGLDMAIELIPDLVISDVMMPLMDGFEFCRHLKSDARTSHIPVIMLTAKADLDSKLEGLEHGANVYLAKPFEAQELLLHIRNLFELRNKVQRHYQRLIDVAAPIGIEIDPRDTEQTEDPFVGRVREIIEAHIDDFNFSVEQLAKALHLSHSQLGRKLNALTGFTPKRFIRNIRLKKAMELLVDREISITTVAYDCGFNDPGYFARVFKKEVGKTPMEWRQ